ncbi:MAG: hypothetical protein K6G88_13805 [Lachnospiraceae bacterium]|nr:hypothetical protein [Lachnospiraceae bacterium]
MILNILQKQIGKNRKKIEPVQMTFEQPPTNLRELIEYTVTIMVESFNERVRKGTEDSNIRLMTDEEIDSMAELGRVAFGIVYNEKEQSVEKAVDTALMAYIDGMVRIFINGELTDVPGNDGVVRLEDLEEYKLNLKDGDEIAFIRLAMLAGRMW